MNKVHPVIIATWTFGRPASVAGWQRLSSGASALDAIEHAGNVTELDTAVNSVGYGGLPNAEGVVELDAAIMDGATHSAGAVGAITGIRTPISVARKVMETTPHVMLVGRNATRFALNNGFQEEETLTDVARDRWKQWRRSRSEAEVAHFPVRSEGVESLVPDNHDTIGLCALDCNGHLAAGCTTSGMAWKLPGRVGDSPIIGAGIYVDDKAGAAAATGHGDEMMKACLTFFTVSRMAAGCSPQEACEEAILYLQSKRPPRDHGQYGAAIIALDRFGTVGAAATVSGFSAPDRRWIWAECRSNEPELREGVYVSQTLRIETLPLPSS